MIHLPCWTIPMLVYKYVGVNDSPAMLATNRRYCDINQWKTSSYPNWGSIDESVECLSCLTLWVNRTLPMFVSKYVGGMICLPCWLLGGQQVWHQAYLMLTGFRLWLWNSEEMSSEVQNSSIRDWRMSSVQSSTWAKLSFLFLTFAMKTINAWNEEALFYDN